MRAVGDDNFLRENIHTIKKSTEALLVTCKNIGL
jgi:hypothetical protein